MATGTTTDHLTPDEVDDALSYRLEEAAADHLAECHSCQTTVEWQRLAKLNQLDELDTDWYCRSMAALAERARQVGHSLMYATQSNRSRLAWFRFEEPPRVVIRIADAEPISVVPVPIASAALGPTPLVDEAFVERILRRLSRGEVSTIEAVQQLVLLGFDPEEAWRKAGR